MGKIALVNANSFGRYFPEVINQLENKYEKIQRFKFASDVTIPELISALKEFTFIVIGTAPQLTADFFEQMENLKLVARFGVGYDNVDIQAANNQGVMVSNIPAFMEKEDVAEHAVALTLAAAKRLVFASTKVQQGEWANNRGRYLGYRVNKKTVGVCGFGNIGSRYGEMMSKAFDCRIIAYDPFLSDEEIQNHGGEKVGLETLLAEADIISLHMNSTEENNKLFSSAIFKKMKSSAILVNAARGSLVDEEDIMKALNEEEIAAYAVDVLDKEPPANDHPFLSSDKVILTPHIGAYNRECNYMMCESVVDDINRVDCGKEPKHRVTE